MGKAATRIVIVFYLAVHACTVIAVPRNTRVSKKSREGSTAHYSYSSSSSQAPPTGNDAWPSLGVSAEGEKGWGKRFTNQRHGADVESLGEPGAGSGKEVNAHRRRHRPRVNLKAVATNVNKSLQQVKKLGGAVKNKLGKIKQRFSRGTLFGVDLFISSWIQLAVVAKAGATKAIAKLPKARANTDLAVAGDEGVHDLIDEGEHDAIAEAVEQERVAGDALAEVADELPHVDEETVEPKDVPRAEEEEIDDLPNEGELELMKDEHSSLGQAEEVADVMWESIIEDEAGGEEQQEPLSEALDDGSNSGHLSELFLEGEEEKGVEASASVRPELLSASKDVVDVVDVVNQVEGLLVDADAVGNDSMDALDVLDECLNTLTYLDTEPSPLLEWLGPTTAQAVEIALVFGPLSCFVALVAAFALIGAVLGSCSVGIERMLKRKPSSLDDQLSHRGISHKKQEEMEAKTSAQMSALRALAYILPDSGELEDEKPKQLAHGTPASCY
ncbi:unnamed protein product [Chrysoparadoxa australica]